MEEAIREEADAAGDGRREAPGTREASERATEPEPPQTELPRWLAKKLFRIFR